MVDGLQLKEEYNIKYVIVGLKQMFVDCKLLSLNVNRRNKRTLHNWPTDGFWKGCSCEKQSLKDKKCHKLRWHIKTSNNQDFNII